MGTRFKDYYTEEWITLIEGKLAQPLGTAAAQAFAVDARQQLAAAGDPSFSERQDLFAGVLSADQHVRRCASECLRISLPWASRLMVAVEHFDRFRAVLDPLRADPERFVQRSVGNNLNDLMKLRPDLAREIIDAWEAELGSAPAEDAGGARATRWIIHHGTRSLRTKARR